MPRRICLLIAGLLIHAPALHADGPADNNPDTVRPVPKIGIDVPEADRQELEAGLAKLESKLKFLRPAGEPFRRESPVGTGDFIGDDENRKAWDKYADVAIFHRAVRVALEDQEFFDPKDIEAAKKLLSVGQERAEQLTHGNTPWLKQTGLVVRGYISMIDHTPQPYGLVIPGNYDFKGRPNSWRLDVWCHGRGETLSELNFIAQRMTSVGPISPPDTIVLHPYGRYCNANKFAGEIDTFEALRSATRTHPYASNKVAMRGFSMGGAACWQFAVHYPGRWFAATPGAGFSETPEFLKFFQKETLDPPWWEEKLWRWYDCPGYVENLRNLPVVAYSGEDDIQKQAADLMEVAYEKAGMKLPHIIAPKTGHSITPEAAKEIEAKLAEWASQVKIYRPLPDKLEFVTYSLIYPHAGWIHLSGLKEHWEEARISVDHRADGNVHVTTKNVMEMWLNLGSWVKVVDPTRLVIDEQPIQQATAAEHPFQFTFVDGKWIHSPKKSPEAQLRKNDRTCGPIDHAFMSSFIFVKPSKQCAHPEVQKWVDAEMNRAITQWRRQFRGDARVKFDTEITEDDVQNANLVLWGDRKSNAWIEKIADKLPIKWSNSDITAGEQKFDSPNHALIAIYPNPKNPRRYIVLNSGFTYREYDYLNNARQTPKLPDWAVIDLSTPPNSRWPGKIVAADFFDEEWQLKPLRK